MEQDKPGLSTKFLLRWSLLELRERFKRSWLATLMVGLCSNSKTVHKAKTSQAARVIIQSSTYWLFFFTDFLPDKEVRYNSAWALIALISIDIALNILFYLYQNYKKLLDWLKATYLKLKERYRMSKQ